jgi:hypothetical protein
MIASQVAPVLTREVREFFAPLKPARLSPHIPLEDAVLCLDCDSFHSSVVCPGCSSRAYIPASRYFRPLEGNRWRPWTPPPIPPTKEIR